MTGEFYPSDADADDDARDPRPPGGSPGAVRQGPAHALRRPAPASSSRSARRRRCTGSSRTCSASTTTCWRCSPTTRSSATSVSFNQALCGLYAAGLGSRQPARRPATAATRGTASATHHACAGTRRAQRASATDDRITQLGRLFAGVLEQGLRIYGAEPGAPTCRLPQPLDAPVTHRCRAGRRHRRRAGPARGRAGLRRRQHRPDPRRPAVHRRASPTRLRERDGRHADHPPGQERGRRCQLRDDRRSSRGHQARRPPRTAGRRRASSASTPPATRPWTTRPGWPSAPASTRCATPASRW